MSNNFTLHTDLTQLISSEQAFHYRVVPKQAYNGTIVFRSESNSEALKQELEIVLGKAVKLEKASANSRVI